jgi:LacI family transcriptional regulator
MKQRRTSLKDIAKRMGVSIATVSRALSNSHEVSEETKRKIQTVAREMNYRPNPFAQSLRKEAPHIIGVVVPNLVAHYYAAVLDGIEDYARQKGYSVFSSNSHESNELETLAIDNFISMHVDGIIACLAQDTTDYSHFEEIHRMGIPLVFFARTCLPNLFSQVVADGDVAAQKATQHLIDAGNKRIAFLGGPNHLDMVRRRKHGYLEALRHNKIPVDRSLVVNGKIDFQTAREAAVQLLRRDDRPDAILAFNDIVTYAAFDAIRSMGLRIPDDVAIIGFSDTESGLFVTPTLSVISDQAHQQGMKACELLLRNINGDHTIYQEVVPMELKIREDGINSYEQVMLIYRAALKQMNTRLEILSEEFQQRYKYNPIEHIKSRMKSGDSIARKLRRRGCESSLENMVRYCNDIAGIRIICSFTSDIYHLAEIISSQRDLEVILIKDYIKRPKPSGYKSYHMLVMMPVYFSEQIIETKVEIQIRTIAMDFWASLEHKIQYKFVGEAPEHIRAELLECSAMISALDAKMLSLNQEIMEQSEMEDKAAALLEQERRKAKFRAQNHSLYEDESGGFPD